MPPALVGGFFFFFFLTTEPRGNLGGSFPLKLLKQTHLKNYIPTSFMFKSVFYL